MNMNMNHSMKNPKYLNTNSNQNLEKIKKEYDISNLNFKSLANLNGNNQNRKLNQINSITLPNDSNVESTTRLKKSKFKSYSQTNLNRDPLSKHNLNNEEIDYHIENSLNINNNLTGNHNISDDNLNYELNISMTSNNSKFLNQPSQKKLEDLPEKIIIQNLESELRERSYEIKILKKNFKEKIILMEQENKKTYDQIEIKHKMEINNLQQNYKEMLNEFEFNHENNRKKYEEFIKKIIREYNTIKNSTIPLVLHNQKINELNFKWKENFEMIKKLFHEKLGELVKNFETPDYVYLLERINYYNKYKEKFDKDDWERETKFKHDQFTIFLDKIKLKIVDVQCSYLKEMIEIERNYEMIFNSGLKCKKDKLEELKEIVNKKFDQIEALKSFLDCGFGDNEDVNIHLSFSGINPINPQNYQMKSPNNNPEYNSLKNSLNLRESFGNKDLQFSSTLLKNALGSPIEGESINKSEFNEIQLGKDNFNTFKNMGSIEKFSNMSNMNVESEDLGFEGIAYKKRLSSLSQSEDLSTFLINDESENTGIHRPSKILHKQYNLSDFNKL